MRAIFHKQELLVLLKDFYELTGLRAVVFDSLGVDILSYPNQLPNFCQLVRNSDNGFSNCIICDKKACDMAQKSTKAIIYTCHAGLLEMITPIRIQDATVGYLLLSHIVKGENEKEEWNLVKSCCKSYDINTIDLKESYLKLPRTSEKKLKAAADLLTLSAKALYQEKLAVIAPNSLQSKLISFLSEHLSEDLSCNRLCKEFSISRTNLYHLSNDIFGCGISEQICYMRINQAKNLLCDTNLPISDICQKVGYSDYNYFYRVFRRHTGTTPNQYRKQSLSK